MSLPSRSKLPSQAPGGRTLRQRPPGPPHGNSSAQADPAPRKSPTRLILIVAALVGILLGGAIGFFVFTGKNNNTANGKATPIPTSASYLGMVSFTTTGGLAGDFTINLPKATPPPSSIQQGASERLLEVVVKNADMDFQLGISPYPGPGDYTLLPFEANPDPGSYHGTVRISNNQASWSLHTDQQCQVSIASDTALNLKAQDKLLHEVKGSFTCPELANDTGNKDAIAVTQGQFDVYAEMFG
jgi:hypothetical protein